MNSTNFKQHFYFSIVPVLVHTTLVLPIFSFGNSPLPARPSQVSLWGAAEQPEWTRGVRWVPHSGVADVADLSYAMKALLKATIPGASLVCSEATFHAITPQRKAKKYPHETMKLA